MHKIQSFIFSFSPKKLALYLVLGPLLLFFVHTVSTIAFSSFSETSSIDTTLPHVILGILFILLTALIALTFFWMRSTIFSVEKSDLGLPMKWFYLALTVFVIYLLYNLCFPLVDRMSEDFQNIFYPFSEFIAFGGLIIAYPLLCHYTARAVVVKRNNEPATFLKALPYTLLLIFGTVLGIPFLHKYFSTKTSTNAQIIIIYAFAFGLFMLILILGFIAAITGMV